MYLANTDTLVLSVVVCLAITDIHVLSVIVCAYINLCIHAGWCMCIKQ